MTREEFVPPQESLDLKELGFNEECFGYYTHNEKLCRYSNSNSVEFETCKHTNIYNTYSLAPLYQQAFRWFSKTFDNSSYVSYYDTGYDEQPRVYYFNIKTKDFETMDDNSQNEEYCYRGFKTHEEAELACIRKLIAMVKNEQA